MTDCENEEVSACLSQNEFNEFVDRAEEKGVLPEQYAEEILSKFLDGKLVDAGDADALLSALENLENEAPGPRLETLLDRRTTPKKKDGDYLVVQKEVHEQFYLVRSGNADSKEEAARQVTDAGATLYGTAVYDRPLENAELEVAEVGEDSMFGTHIDPSDL